MHFYYCSEINWFNTFCWFLGTAWEEGKVKLRWSDTR